MKIRYIRFRDGIGTPGVAGNTITRAFLRSKEAATMGSDVIMDEIALEGSFVVLRAFRSVGGKPVLFERYTPITNIVDFEVVPDAKPTKKDDTK